MNQNTVEHLGDMVNLKKMTADEANVELVRSERVRVVREHGIFAIQLGFGVHA